MQQSDILLHHVLRTTLMSLDILEQHSIITPTDVSSIRVKLQTHLAASPPHHSQPLLQPPSQHMTATYQSSPPIDNHSVPPLPPRQISSPSVQQDDSQLVKAVALWDYSGTAADDLNFRKDDIIVIDQESEWKGMERGALVKVS
jgi:LAS seventeen-binding protein 1/2